MEKKELSQDEVKQITDAEKFNTYVKEEGWPFDNRTIKKLTIKDIRIDGAEIKGIVIQQSKISNCEFNNVQFKDCVFVITKIRKTIFRKCEFKGCKFLNVDGDSVEFIGSSFKKVEIKEQELFGSTDFNNSGFKDCTFDSSMLKFVIDSSYAINLKFIDSLVKMGFSDITEGENIKFTGCKLDCSFSGKITNLYFHKSRSIEDGYGAVGFQGNIDNVSIIDCNNMYSCSFYKNETTNLVVKDFKENNSLRFLESKISNLSIENSRVPFIFKESRLSGKNVIRNCEIDGFTFEDSKLSNLLFENCTIWAVMNLTNATLENVKLKTVRYDKKITEFEVFDKGVQYINSDKLDGNDVP